MARIIICDVCDESYTENRFDQQKVELNGKFFKVYLDIDGGDNPDYYRLDVCPACKKQAVKKMLAE